MALLLVTAQTIITESYPIAKRGMAQAIYGMGVIVGPTLGPPLGGYLVDNLLMALYFLYQYSYWYCCYFFNDSYMLEVQNTAQNLKPIK